MEIQDRPVCYCCDEDIDTGVVFQAACGHARCPSVAFHGMCLMAYREHHEEHMRVAQKMAEFLRQHLEHDDL
jgi:hypothetical protein